MPKTPTGIKLKMGVHVPNFDSRALNRMFQRVVKVDSVAKIR